MSPPSPTGATGSAAGIILGGSHVWRASPARCLEPRLLLPVANVPLVTYTLHWLRRAGLRDVVVCVNESTRLVQRQLRDGGEAGMRVQYFVDRMPRGPAGCLRDASELVDADNFVVIDGSIVPSLDLRAMLAAHVRQQSAATLAIHVGEGAGDEDPGEASPVGVHVFSRPAVRQIPTCGYQDLKETLVPHLLRAGFRVAAFPARCSSPRINDLQTFLAVQSWALERAATEDGVRADYPWLADAAIHPTAWLAADVRVIGPVMVGAGTRIEHRALLIGPVVVGRDCFLAREVVVSNSVVCDRAVLEPGARVDSCVVPGDAMIHDAHLEGDRVCAGLARVDHGDRRRRRTDRHRRPAAPVAVLTQGAGPSRRAVDASSPGWTG